MAKANVRARDETNAEEMSRRKRDLAAAEKSGDRSKIDAVKLEIRKLQGEIDKRAGARDSTNPDILPYYRKLAGMGLEALRAEAAKRAGAGDALAVSRRAAVVAVLNKDKIKFDGRIKDAIYVPSPRRGVADKLRAVGATVRATDKGLVVTGVKGKDEELNLKLAKDAKYDIWRSAGGWNVRRDDGADYSFGHEFDKKTKEEIEKLVRNLPQTAWRDSVWDAPYLPGYRSQYASYNVIIENKGKRSKMVITAMSPEDAKKIVLGIWPAVKVTNVARSHRAEPLDSRDAYEGRLRSALLIIDYTIWYGTNTESYSVNRFGTAAVPGNPKTKAAATALAQADAKSRGGVARIKWDD